jgi:hypothetical protein
VIDGFDVADGRAALALAAGFPALVWGAAEALAEGLGAGPFESAGALVGGFVEVCVEGLSASAIGVTSGTTVGFAFAGLALLAGAAPRADAG